jgi:putative transposase
MHNDPGRIWLRHDPPPWIDPAASSYFITICCQQRGTNQLCHPGVGEALLRGARIYHEPRKCCPSLLLLMPDHLHMLVSFGREYRMVDVIGGWKRYAARQHGIDWQRNFFEHRLRSEESVEEKAAYILQNPVRAGLVAEGCDWPFTLRLD